MYICNFLIVLTNIHVFVLVDAPWCDIRPSHTSSKHVKTQFPSKKKERWQEGANIKGRNEPRNIMYVCMLVSLCNYWGREISENITTESTL